MNNLQEIFNRREFLQKWALTTVGVLTSASVFAEKNIDKEVSAMFSYQSSPYYRKIYELLHEGIIGKITSVDFHWYEDSNHKIDYCHHFDLLNQWLKSEPKSVYAQGANENREKYKMAATIHYTNDAIVSYSLTTSSPYKGHRIILNGTKGRLEGWINESEKLPTDSYNELILSKDFGESESIKIPKPETFHCFKATNPSHQSPGSGNERMAALVSLGARKSIQTGLPVKIADLTDLKPIAVKA